MVCFLSRMAWAFQSWGWVVGTLSRVGQVQSRFHDQTQPRLLFVVQRMRAQQDGSVGEGAC